MPSSWISSLPVFGFFGILENVGWIKVVHFFDIVVIFKIQWLAGGLEVNKDIGIVISLQGKRTLQGKKQMIGMR
jgi:hypothetical protein